MPRFLLPAILAVLVLIPATTAAGKSGPHVRGTVAEKNAARHLVAVRSARQAFALRVPGTLTAIRLGQRVELRGSTLRARGHDSHVLARNVSILSSGPLSTPSTATANDDEQDDEVEIKGTLTSLGSLVTVQSATRSLSCADSGGLATGFVVGELVEMKCDLVGGQLVLRKLEREDEEQAGAAAEDDHAGAVSDDADDDHGVSPGGGDDEHDD